MKSYFITIEGMGCDHCVKSVTTALEGLGANAIEVKVGSASAEFAGDPSALKAAIEDAGFDVVALEEK